MTVKPENDRRFEMNMPGFTAVSSLGRTMGIYHGTQGIYHGKVVFGGFPSEAGGGVVPQLRFQSDPDVGAYWRCRANGGAISYAVSLAGFLPSQSVAC
jgi:hypothetical protein